MKNYQSADEPVWPYVGVVTCLFVLSILASRSWKTSPGNPSPPNSAHHPTATRDDPVAIELGVLVGQQASRDGFAARTAVRPTERRPDREPIGRELQETARAEQTQLVGPLLNPAGAAGDAEGMEEGEAADIELAEDFPTPRQTVEIEPPVSEKIELDLSVAEIPTRRPEVESAFEQQTLPPRRRQLIERRADKPLRAQDPEPAESDWPHPVVLVKLLEAIQTHDQTSDWASRGNQALERFQTIDELSSMAARDLLHELRSLSEEAPRLAEAAASEDLRADVLRAGYGIERRVLIWEQVHRIADKGAHDFVSFGFHDLEPVLEAVNQHLGEGDVARGWRSYLKLADLDEANRRGDTATQQQLARRVLERMRSEEWLGDQQRAYLEDPPFTEFSHALQRWAREPIDYTGLLQTLEAYESGRGSAESAQVAKIYQVARWSGDSKVNQLAEMLNTHYRNANLRVAVTGELINRLLPQPKPAEDEVDEYLLGAYVHGTSRTTSDLKVVLIPDRRIWKLGLEANGVVESSTAASKGPATFYNEGNSEFVARKVLLVDSRGVKVARAEAEANSETELTGFRTNLDSVPVVGLLARAIARQQHAGRYYDARQAAEARLAEKARERLDNEVHQRLEEIENEFNQRILRPFQALSLRPTALDMQTTDKRLIIRYRLAGGTQLGAHTPRPQAPSDSLLSVQIHETVLNNLIGQLKLEGVREDLRSLYRKLADRFQRTDLQVPEEIPEDVVVQFAARDAFRVQLESGRVMMTVRIAELKKQQRRWRNFAVRAYYIPDPSQLEANLVREGVIELAGSRLRLGDQIALRGIFSKVFSKRHAVNIINKRLAGHPRMSDLQVTQFVITDGWIGVALGPQRVLEHLAREPAELTR